VFFYFFSKSIAKEYNEIKLHSAMIFLTSKVFGWHVPWTCTSFVWCV